MTFTDEYMHNCKDDGELKAGYKSWKGHYPTDFGHWIGVSQVWILRRKMNFWASFIDSIIPDWFPLNYVQSGLINIVDYVFQNMQQHEYNTWAEKGDDIVNRLNNLITDTQNRINNAVNNMKDRIDKEIIDPIRAKTKELDNTLTQAQIRLQNIDSTLSTFQKRANALFTDHENRIKTLEAKMQQTPLGILEEIVKGGEKK